MTALGLLIERFERSQDEAEQERQHAFLTRRTKTSKEMTASDLMAEGLSVNKAGDAAEKVRAMHMRRSGGLKGLVDPTELPPLGPGRGQEQGQAAAVSAASLGGEAGAASLDDGKLPALVPQPAAAGSEGAGAAQAPPPAAAGAMGLVALTTSSDLLYLEQAGLKMGRADLSADPLEWTIEEVGRWLESLSLAMHCQTFAQHLVDGETLLSLTPQDISESLRVTKLGHCKVLAKGILALRARALGESALGKAKQQEEAGAAASAP
jgi:hypothetical protein